MRYQAGGPIEAYNNLFPQTPETTRVETPVRLLASYIPSSYLDSLYMPPPTFIPATDGGGNTTKSKSKDKIYERQMGGIQEMGYRLDSPYKSLPFIKINSNRISTKNMNVPMQTSEGILEPNKEYYFPHTKSVLEMNPYQTGGDPIQQLFMAYFQANQFSQEQMQQFMQEFQEMSQSEQQQVVQYIQQELQGGEKQEMPQQEMQEVPQEQTGGEYTPTKMPNVSKEDVKRVQDFLNKEGWNAGKVDGIIGPKTKNALAYYNEHWNGAGYSADGMIQVLEKLNKPDKMQSGGFLRENDYYEYGGLQVPRSMFQAGAEYIEPSYKFQNDTLGLESQMRGVPEVRNPLVVMKTEKEHTATQRITKKAAEKHLQSVEDVKKIQQKLIDAGYTNIGKKGVEKDVDGIMGPRTRAAMAKYAKLNNIQGDYKDVIKSIGKDLSDTGTPLSTPITTLAKIVVPEGTSIFEPVVKIPGKYSMGRESEPEKTLDEIRKEQKRVRDIQRAFLGYTKPLVGDSKKLSDKERVQQVEKGFLGYNRAEEIPDAFPYPVSPDTWDGYNLTTSSGAGNPQNYVVPESNQDSRMVRGSILNKENKNPAYPRYEAMKAKFGNPFADGYKVISEFPDHFVVIQRKSGKAFRQDKKTGKLTPQK